MGWNLALDIGGCNMRAGGDVAARGIAGMHGPAPDVTNDGDRPFMRARPRMCIDVHAVVVHAQGGCRERLSV